MLPMIEILDDSGPLAYVLAALLMAIPMGPAEVTSLTSGTLSTTTGLNFWIMLPALCLGAFIGDMATFLLSRKATSHLTQRWKSPNDQWHRRHVAWSHRLIGHIGLAVVLARFIPAARTPIAALAGTSSLSTCRYLGFSSLGVCLWVVAYTTAGYLLGEHAAAFAPVLLGAVLPLAVIAAAFAMLNRILRRTKEKGACTEDTMTPLLGHVAARSETTTHPGPRKSKSPQLPFGRPRYGHPHSSHRDQHHLAVVPDGAVLGRRH